MRPTEAVMLTGYLRAHFPSQPVDEFTTEALEETLAAYPAADCRQAVLNIADRGEHWCSPTDIKAEVKRIRAKRVADYGPIEPPAGLDPDNVRDYHQWLAATTRAIADGEVTAPGELGWDYPARDVIAELGQVGQQVPPINHTDRAAEARKMLRSAPADDPEDAA